MAKKSSVLNYVLFLVTILTTTLGGNMLFGNLLAGGIFSATLMTILLVHEMGHYFSAKKHSIDVTLPYFIPAPFFIGTFGAVIKMKSKIPNKNALMDVGSAGPLYGFIASLVAVAIGMALSPVMDDPVSNVFNASLLFSGMSYLIKGVSHAYLAMNPVLFAGWLGFYVTMLNLLPLGQLDGGHVTYALFGKSKHYKRCANVFFLLLIAWGFFCYIAFNFLAWLLFALLILLFGIVHQPIENGTTKLTLWNKAKGWICIAIFVFTFMPVPFNF